MADHPLFSVVVPIYGVEPFINQCIDSLLAQTCSDFQLILVDDGSPDQCGAICDSYAEKDSRILVVHKANGGLVSARQAGAEKAAGEYVVCVDGDDWVAPGYLQSFADAIAASNADIIVSGSIWWTSETQAFSVLPSVPAGLYDRGRMEAELFSWLIEDTHCRYFPNSMWAKAFRRSLYVPLQMQVDPAFKIGEDCACVKPVVYGARSVSVITDCLYYYRQNPSAMTKNRKPFDWNGPECIARHFESHIPMAERDFQAQVYRNCVHNLFNVAVTAFYGSGSYREICALIRSQLELPYYADAIEQASFAFGSKGWLAHCALKYRWFFLMKLFNRTK